MDSTDEATKDFLSELGPKSNTIVAVIIIIVVLVLLYLFSKTKTDKSEDEPYFGGSVRDDTNAWSLEKSVKELINKQEELLEDQL